MANGISKAQEKSNQTKAIKYLRFDSLKLKAHIERKRQREADLLTRLAVVQKKIQLCEQRLLELSQPLAKAAQ